MKIYESDRLKMAVLENMVRLHLEHVWKAWFMANVFGHIPAQDMLQRHILLLENVLELRNLDDKHIRQVRNEVERVRQMDFFMDFDTYDPDWEHETSLDKMRFDSRWLAIIRRSNRRIRLLYEQGKFSLFGEDDDDNDLWANNGSDDIWFDDDDDTAF